VTETQPSFEIPERAQQYLTPQQLKLHETLIEEGFILSARAYEAAVKIVFLFRHQNRLNLDILSDSMATCLLSHLIREIVVVLMREVSEGNRIDYLKHLEKLKTLWIECGFKVDGTLPPYKLGVAVDAGDILFPKLPVEFVSKFLHEHMINFINREQQAALLLHDIYGERSDENELLRNKKEWLKNPELTKYAHLNIAIHGSDELHFEEVMEKFNTLEGLLAEYAKSFYEKVDEIDDILSEANRTGG